jgi:RNA polymerase sigma factor (sigma-70 family)
LSASCSALASRLRPPAFPRPGTADAQFGDDRAAAHVSGVARRAKSATYDQLTPHAGDSTVSRGEKARLNGGSGAGERSVIPCTGNVVGGPAADLTAARGGRSAGELAKPCELVLSSVYRGMSSDSSLDERFTDVHAGGWTSVFRFALSLTNDWDAAEDLAQEAFSRLWIHRTELDWNHPLLPWLLTTTRRLALDRFRRIRRALLRGHRGQARLPDGDDRIRWLDVQRSVAGMAPLDRAALTMVAVSGLTYEEAAEVLGTTPGAIRARVSRARRRLGDETE